jgi:hypothetical protein
MDQPDIADVVTGLELKLRHSAPEKLDALSRKLDIELREYVAFQEVKSLAQADGRLSYENACYIYNQLGAGPEDFNNRPVAVKIILTQVFAQLLKPVEV